jgi:hypothetical protein
MITDRIVVVTDAGFCDPHTVTARHKEIGPCH